MKTKDIRIGETYICDGTLVKVISRHKGTLMKRSSIWASSTPHKRTSFILSDGQQVYSDKLEIE